jgi:ABC-type Fe3+-hydroxamate transport system substrate-binding protein
LSVRVVSLVPSASETLMAWGVRPVAVTRFCELPGLPTVGGTKNPDIAAIVALAPDVVVLDREENRLSDAEALEAAGVPIHVTHVRRVADVAPMLSALAAAVGLGEEPDRADEQYRAEEQDRAEEQEEAGNVAGGGGRAGRSEGLRVWVPIWRRPWMTINDDTYGGSMLEACGVVNVFGGHPDRYPTVSLEEVAALGPDVVLAPTEPYPFQEKHRNLFTDVAPMVIVDGQDLFWWGVRTRPAVERLRARLGALSR